MPQVGADRLNPILLARVQYTGLLEGGKGKPVWSFIVVAYDVKPNAILGDLQTPEFTLNIDEVISVPQQQSTIQRGTVEILDDKVGIHHSKYGCVPCDCRDDPFRIARGG